VPTSNQVIQVLVALRRSEFAFVEVCDVSVLFYKAETSRFRPTDRMISHTGYLVFARPVSIDRSGSDEKLLKEIGLISKLETNEQSQEELDD
jgi:tRNA (adenine57-N1/adenine58-N1)-methyltransferase